MDQLDAQLKVAMSAPEVEPVDEAAIAASDEAYVRSLADLRERYDEWSRVARVAVKRSKTSRTPSKTAATPSKATGGRRLFAVLRLRA